MPAPSPALPRVVELVRVSSRGQADRDTPEDQRAALDRLRVSRPGILVRRIEYQGSGASPGASRPDLLELATLAHARAFDEVRVRHLDRLTRHEDPRERYAIFGLVADAGAVIVDAGGHVIDPASEMGELDFGFQSIIASRERKRILERTMAGKRRLAAQGRLVVGRPPWGRTWNGATGTWGVEPGALAEYRQLFDLVLSGVSLRTAAAQLNAEGRTTPTGRAWSASTIHRLICARHAAGEFQTHGATVQIPPVVDPATQAEAVQRLAGNDRASGRHDAFPALLRKLAICGACDRRVTTDRGSRGEGLTVRRYYRCHGCGRVHRVELVDEAVVARLRAWLARPGPLAAAAGSDRTQAKNEAAAAARRAKLDLRGVGVQEERLARAATRGDLTPRAVSVRAGELARLRAQVERDLAEAEARLAAEDRWEAESAEVETRVAALREGVARAGFAEWRDLVTLLFPPGSVVLWPDGRLELRGVLPLDDLGLTQAGRARRDPSGGSRRAGQNATQTAPGGPGSDLSAPCSTGRRVAVRLDAWTGRRKP